MPHARYRPHPGLILSGWALFAVVLQQMPLSGLVGVSLLVVVLASVLAPGRFFALLRRSRFLLLALFLIYTLTTPGERLANLPDWLPLRREACALAFRHMLGLIALLASLSLVLERLSLEELVAGLWSVSFPLALLGVPRDRAALRLLLVLDGLQRKPGLGWRDWLTPESTSQPAAVSIERRPWRGADFGLLALAAAIAVNLLMNLR